MPETKRFMSYPIWSNSIHSRQIWGRHQHNYKSTKNATWWFFPLPNCFVQQRSSVRILKFIIIVALILTCVFNIKLAIEAKIKYDHHLKFFVNVNEMENTENNFHVKRVLDKSSLIKIQVLSSKNAVEVKVNNELIYQDHSTDAGRGLHVIILNEFTGLVTANLQFDTFVEGVDESLRFFIKSIKNEKRIVVFAVKDEASLNLNTETRKVLEELGCKKVNQIGWRSMWAAITTMHGNLYAEDVTASPNPHTWGEPVKINAVIELALSKSNIECHWPNTPENKRREAFCLQYDGYGDLCSCNKEIFLDFTKSNFSHNNVYNIPVTVIASNRPHYLYRMLKSLNSASGFNPNQVLVYIDGYYQEPMEVVKLFGVKGIFHQPVGEGVARISQNYKASLTATFNQYPNALYTIVLEEDLDVSPDIFRYFSQTLPLLQNDSSLYCISAWNDHGYHHSCNDPALIYRVEGFPGLGWLLSRKLFKKELEPNWPSPEKMWDWDMWMRTSRIRKKRECIIPDVSRTFHFGIMGINMNNYFHQLYFSSHKINLLDNVKLNNTNMLIKDNYEKLMHSLVREAIVLNHEISPCHENFISADLEHSDSYVAFLEANPESVYTVFQNLFKCLKTWDLDVRGIHKDSFRTFIKTKHIIFIAYPLSPYSLYKPVEIIPIDITAIE